MISTRRRATPSVTADTDNEVINTPNTRPVTRDDVRAVLDDAYSGRRGSQATT